MTLTNSLIFPPCDEIYSSAYKTYINLARNEEYNKKLNELEKKSTKKRVKIKVF